MPDAYTAAAVAAAVIATYLLRFAGVLVAGRVEEGSPFYNWIGCVAYAIAAGLMMKLLLFPAGVLAQTALSQRLAALAVAVAVFGLCRRRLLPAIAAGVAVLFALLRAGGA